MKNIYKSTLVVLPELARQLGQRGVWILEELLFEDCDVEGPGILVVLEAAQIRDCTFGVANNDIETILWEVSQERSAVVGAIGTRACLFEGCRFFGVGFAGPKAVLGTIRHSTKG